MCSVSTTLSSDWMLTGVFVMAVVPSSSCDWLCCSLCSKIWWSIWWLKNKKRSFWDLHNICMSLRLQIECDPAEWDQRKSIQDLKSQTYKPESNTCHQHSHKTNSSRLKQSHHPNTPIICTYEQTHVKPLYRPIQTVIIAHQHSTWSCRPSIWSHGPWTEASWWARLRREAPSGWTPGSWWHWGKHSSSISWASIWRKGTRASWAVHARHRWTSWVRHVWIWALWSPRWGRVLSRNGVCHGCPTGWELTWHRGELSRSSRVGGELSRSSRVGGELSRYAWSWRVSTWGSRESGKLARGSWAGLKGTWGRRPSLRKPRCCWLSRASWGWEMRATRGRTRPARIIGGRSPISRSWWIGVFSFRCFIGDIIWDCVSKLQKENAEQSQQIKHITESLVIWYIVIYIIVI